MKLLLIEDEVELAEAIIRYLSGQDMICEWSSDIQASLEKVSQYEYDCILLDLSLPDGNGLDILRELKHLKRDEGVIIISAKEYMASKIEGLQSGADDYITKPFHMAELLARIQALIRRKYFKGGNFLQFKEIEVDFLKKTVMVSGVEVILTKKEYELLVYLMGNQNRVLSKSAIAEHLSGDQADLLISHDFVYAHMKNLKRKLADSGCRDYIKTIYGLGYRWEL
jgi:DNA-binding response OmpR family regulator